MMRLTRHIIRSIAWKIAIFAGGLMLILFPLRHHSMSWWEFTLIGAGLYAFLLVIFLIGARFDKG